MSSNSMNSGNPHSGIYEADTAKTLDLNGGNPTCNQGGIFILENHPNDSRVKISEDGTVQTLTSRMGTGGGNTPMIMTEAPPP
jgi:DNA (cytosine-5)-methyltransferase 1